MVANFQQRFLALKQEIAAGNITGVITRFGDVILVAGVAAMVGMMIVPLPTWLLDILLTINITTAVTVLMVSIYISQPTQIFSFPTLLLITTLYRLSLDISATRLILLQADAGEVIRSFGQFVVRGNFVVGAVIFLIITLVQFIVITKGSERVAEVSARFTLDAMPGKQMAIDADLRAGTITFDQARARRESLARESQFYGAMDGAMKFVKGDAIAGIVITLINIIGGLIIGVAMHGMAMMEAVQTYSILTIGNGLVSQIPALLISISAGMVVTRVASETEDSNLGKDLARQMLGQPKAITITSGLLLVMAIIPGLPKIPFFILAALTGSVAYGMKRATRIAETAKAEGAETPELMKGPDFALTVPLVLQVSQDLTPWVDMADERGKRFYELFTQVRNSLYFQLGVLYPPLQISGNNPFPRGTYQIWLNEVPLISAQIRADMLLVNDSARNIALFGLKGEEARNPATGRPAAWIAREERDRARMAGLQVWDTHEVLVMHLSHFLRKNAREFLGLQEAQWLVEQLKKYYPVLVDEVIPKPVSIQQLTEILQRLVDEAVSIRDLRTIFQALGEWGRYESDVVALTERVRTALKHKICYQLSEGKQLLYIFQLHPEIEEVFRNSIRQGPSGPYLAMDSNSIQLVIDAARPQIGNLPPTAQNPVILTDTDIRRYVKRLLDYHYPDISVLSYDQLTPQINVHPLGTITAPRAVPAAEAKEIASGQA